MPRGSKSFERELQIFDRRRDTNAKRDAILRTAVQLFLERSYARTSLNDVAERLKITKPAIYHYFRNKEDILLECYRWGCMLIRERLDEIAASRSKGLEKVADFIRSYLGVVAVDFGRAVIRLDDGELSSDARAEIRSYKREIDHRLRSFLQAGIDDSSIGPCDPKLTAFAIAGALNGICEWYKPGGPVTVNDIASSFTATFTNGLRKSNNAGAYQKTKSKPALRLVKEAARDGT